MRHECLSQCSCAWVRRESRRPLLNPAIFRSFPIRGVFHEKLATTRLSLRITPPPRHLYAFEGINWRNEENSNTIITIVTCVESAHVHATFLMLVDGTPTEFCLNYNQSPETENINYTRGGHRSPRQRSTRFMEIWFEAARRRQRES